MRTLKLSVWIVAGLAALVSCKMKGDSAQSQRGMDLAVRESSNSEMAPAPMVCRSAPTIHPRKNSSSEKNWSQYIPSHMRKSAQLREEPL